MLGLKVEQNYLHLATSWALKGNKLNEPHFSPVFLTQMEAHSMAYGIFRSSYLLKNHFQF